MLWDAANQECSKMMNFFPRNRVVTSYGLDSYSGNSWWSLLWKVFSAYFSWFVIFSHSLFHMWTVIFAFSPDECGIPLQHPRGHPTLLRWPRLQEYLGFCTRKGLILHRGQHWGGLSVKFFKHIILLWMGNIMSDLTLCIIALFTYLYTVLLPKPIPQVILASLCSCENYEKHVQFCNGAQTRRPHPYIYISHSWLKTAWFFFFYCYHELHGNSRCRNEI